MGNKEPPSSYMLTVWAVQVPAVASKQLFLITTDEFASQESGGTLVLPYAGETKPSCHIV